MEVEKLAPPLIAAYERYVREERRRTPLLRSASMMGLVSVQERAKPLRVVVSLECEPGTVWDAEGTPLEGVELMEGIRVNGAAAGYVRRSWNSMRSPTWPPCPAYGASCPPPGCAPPWTGPWRRSRCPPSATAPV